MFCFFYGVIDHAYALCENVVTTLIRAWRCHMRHGLEPWNEAQKS